MRTRLGLHLLSLAILSACKGSDSNAVQSPNDAGTDAIVSDSSANDVADASDGAPVPSTPVIAKPVSTQVSVAALMFGAGEMQISGEPFARDFMGRNLDGYDRSLLPTDLYSPTAKGGDEIVDIVGFSTAVESYEYSKYHVNMISLQTSAGPSLAWGPVLDATKDPATDEPTVRARLYGREKDLLQASGADVAGFAHIPPPTGNPYNVLGFSGIHPILAPYRSFDPAMTPDTLVGTCTFEGGYAVFSKAIKIPDYECGYTSLQVVRSKLDTTISPAAVGFTLWKQALWGIDFLGRLHDSAGNPIATVADVDLPSVGTPGNTIVGEDDTGAKGAAGTYIGSVALEGTWGLNYLEEADNASTWLLTALTTGDGATLSGFATLSDATSYDYTSPARWWPNAITVTEGAPAQWPSPATTTIGKPADGESHVEDLAALLLGHALWFGMTDARNDAIGGKIGLKATFDGAPFARDDGNPNGEATSHDRALAVMRVAFVDLDRYHTFPGTSVVVDVARPASTGSDAHGTTVTTTRLAHVTIGLRQTLLALNAAITQYGGADPNPKLDDKGILNTVPINPPGGATTFSARVRSVLVAQATFVRDVLTKADGSVANGATFDASGAPTLDPSPTTIESQAAALRALLEGFLATGDTSFVDRARLVYTAMESTFYVKDARFWRGVAGGPDAIAMTPERFAFLQSAIRETHKIANVPGDAVLSKTNLEERMGRVNKLFLNGWDDWNGDSKVQMGAECLAGRLQLGEQALTGEYGHDNAGTLIGDRDSDCILNISWAKQGSLLAGEIDLSVSR